MIIVNLWDNCFLLGWIIAFLGPRIVSRIRHSTIINILSSIFSLHFHCIRLWVIFYLSQRVVIIPFLLLNIFEKAIRNNWCLWRPFWRPFWHGGICIMAGVSFSDRSHEYAICQWFSRVTKSRGKIIGKSHHDWPPNPRMIGIIEMPRCCVENITYITGAFRFTNKTQIKANGLSHPDLLSYLLVLTVALNCQFDCSCPDRKVHGAIMGPIWGRQDPGGPHVGPMNFAIWVVNYSMCWRDAKQYSIWDEFIFLNKWFFKLWSSFWLIRITSTIGQITVLHRAY